MPVPLRTHNTQDDACWDGECPIPSNSGWHDRRVEAAYENNNASHPPTLPNIPDALVVSVFSKTQVSRTGISRFRKLPNRNFSTKHVTWNLCVCFFVNT